MNKTINTGEYAALARLAREKREQEEYINQLRAVLAHCKAARQSSIHTLDVPATGGPRWKIWAHITDAIDLAEQELKRIGVEL